MSVDISVNITEDIVDIIATPTVNIVNVTNSASIDPSLYDLSEFTNTSVNPFVRTSGLSSYVPTTRTLTINGTTQDLSADRTFTVSTGITIGTTAITSGTVGRVLFEGTGNVVSESGNLFWDNTNNRLGLNTSTPTTPLSIFRSGSTNFFNFEPSATGTAPYIQAFFQGGVDARIYFDNTLKLRTGGTSSVYGLDCGSIAANGNIVVSGGTEHKIQLAGSTNNYIQYTDTGAIHIGVIGTADATTYIQVRTGNATNMSTGTLSTAFFNTGNVGINTTTDAGFKLDVNGTARIDQTLQLNATGTGTLIAMGGNIGRFTIDGLFIRFKVTGGGDILNMTTNFFGVNETAVIPSAICAMTSTNRGFLPPRMTTTQKNAIASPAAGLMVYDTTLNLISVYNGTTWITL